MSAPLASVFTDIWDNFADDGRQYVFLVLLGCLGSFGFIRLSTRLMRSPKVPWWPGSVVSEGGLHVHHHVFGIVIMMVAGCASFLLADGSAVWYGIWAAVFGIGMGLTLDEYALWLHLSDVYWAKEGRASVDAALIAVAFLALVMTVALPIDVDSADVWTLVGSLGLLAVHASSVLVSIAKGRFAHAIVGTFVPGVGFYAWARLAKPRSMWARRHYGARRPAKQARAEQRFHPGRRTDRVKERLRDAIGGVPAEVYEARLADAAARREAIEVRRQAVTGTAAEGAGVPSRDSSA